MFLTNILLFNIYCTIYLNHSSKAPVAELFRGLLGVELRGGVPGLLQGQDEPKPWADLACNIALQVALGRIPREESLITSAAAAAKVIYIVLLLLMAKIKLAARIDGLEESATLALNARVKQMAADGKTIYNLTAGELADDTPEYIQIAIAGQLHLNKYTPTPGIYELRQQISKHANEFYSVDWINPANVVVASGAKPALYAALLSIVDPGDEVIVPTPAWVSYYHMIELAGGKVVEVPLSKSFDIDVDAIAKAITNRSKAILINSPHNPTGAIFSDKALIKLAKLLKDSDITVIADDIYSKLVYSEQYKPVPCYDFKHPIIINGFSKSQALTGWRIGYLIADVPVAVAATKILSHITGNASVISQQAAIAALNQGDKPIHLEKLRSKRDLVYKKLSAIQNIKCHKPEGAFYAFMDIRAITEDSLAWCEQLLIETGVALVPGEAFSAPGFVRMSFVVDNRTLTTALDLLGIFARKGKTK